MLSNVPHVKCFAPPRGRGGSSGVGVEMGGRSSRSHSHQSGKKIRNRNFKHSYEQAAAITSTNHSSLCWAVWGEKSRGQRKRAASFFLCSFKNMLKFKSTRNLTGIFNCDSFLNLPTKTLFPSTREIVARQWVIIILQRFLDLQPSGFERNS